MRHCRTGTNSVYEAATAMRDRILKGRIGCSCRLTTVGRPRSLNTAWRVAPLNSENSPEALIYCWRWPNIAAVEAIVGWRRNHMVGSAITARYWAITLAEWSRMIRLSE